MLPAQGAIQAVHISHTYLFTLKVFLHLHSHEKSKEFLSKLFLVHCHCAPAYHRVQVPRIVDTTGMRNHGTLRHPHTYAHLQNLTYIQNLMGWPNATTSVAVTTAAAAAVVAEATKETYLGRFVHVCEADITRKYKRIEIIGWSGWMDEQSKKKKKKITTTAT